MGKTKRILASFGIMLLIVSCAKKTESSAELTVRKSEVEVGKSVEISCRTNMPGDVPVLTWRTSVGRLEPTLVANEVDFIAPDEPGQAVITVRVASGGAELERSVTVKILPAGALKKTASVIVEIDTGTLKKVWVSAEHPAENFAAPLKIKGTFRLDEETGDAFAGGSWPLFTMYDDATHGDRVAKDGIWTIRFNFEKSDAKVYFAFDDANAYRVEFESGLAWRLKMAWIGISTSDDKSNLFFVPDRDQVIGWTPELAKRAGIYAKSAN